MTYFEPSDSSLTLDIDLRKWIHTKLMALDQEDRYDIYEELGMPPNTYTIRGTGHSDPRFNYHFADFTLFSFNICDGDDALMLLAIMVNKGYITAEVTV